MVLPRAETTKVHLQGWGGRANGSVCQQQELGGVRYPRRKGRGGPQKEATRPPSPSPDAPNPERLPPPFSMGD